MTKLVYLFVKIHRVWGYIGLGLRKLDFRPWAPAFGTLGQGLGLGPFRLCLGEHSRRAHGAQEPQALDGETTRFRVHLPGPS